MATGGGRVTAGGQHILVDPNGVEVCLLFLKYGNCRFKEKCKRAHWRPPLNETELQSGAPDASQNNLSANTGSGHPSDNNERQPLSLPPSPIFTPHTPHTPVWRPQPQPTQPQQQQQRHLFPQSHATYPAQLPQALPPFHPIAHQPWSAHPPQFSFGIFPPPRPPPPPAQFAYSAVPKFIESAVHIGSNQLQSGAGSAVLPGGGTLQHKSPTTTAVATRPPGESTDARDKQTPPPPKASRAIPSPDTPEGLKSIMESSFVRVFVGPLECARQRHRASVEEGMYAQNGAVCDAKTGRLIVPWDPATATEGIANSSMPSRQRQAKSVSTTSKAMSGVRRVGDVPGRGIPQIPQAIARRKRLKRLLKRLRRSHWEAKTALSVRLATPPTSYLLTVNLARVNLWRIRPYVYALVLGALLARTSNVWAPPSSDIPSAMATVTSTTSNPASMIGGCRAAVAGAGTLATATKGANTAGRSSTPINANSNTGASTVDSTDVCVGASACASASANYRTTNLAPVALVRESELWMGIGDCIIGWCHAMAQPLPTPPQQRPVMPTGKTTGKTTDKIAGKDCSKFGMKTASTTELSRGQCEVVAGSTAGGVRKSGNGGSVGARKLKLAKRVDATRPGGPLAMEGRLRRMGLREVESRLLVSHLWRVLWACSQSTTGVSREIARCEAQVKKKSRASLMYAVACAAALPASRARRDVVVNFATTTPRIPASVREGIAAEKERAGATGAEITRERHSNKDGSIGGAQRRMELIRRLQQMKETQT